MKRNGNERTVKVVQVTEVDGSGTGMEWTYIVFIFSLARMKYVDQKFLQARQGRRKGDDPRIKGHLLAAQLDSVAEHLLIGLFAGALRRTCQGTCTRILSPSSFFGSSAPDSVRSALVYSLYPICVDACARDRSVGEGIHLQVCGT